MDNYVSVSNNNDNPGWRPFRSNIKKIVIEDGVSSVGNYAFEDFNNLDSVIIGNTLTQINGSSFRNCVKLKGINFPTSLTSIGDYAFYGAPIDSLYLHDDVTINLNAFNNLVYLNTSGTIAREAFRANKSLKTVVMRKGVIGDMSFFECDLDSLEIQNGVTEIGQNAFQWCRNLKSVTIPSSVKTIELFAFYECDKLNKVDISAEIIRSKAFFGCSEIQSLILREGISRIEDSFSECSLLDSVYLPSTLTLIAYNAFDKRVSFGVSEDNNHYMSDNGILFNKAQTVLISFPTKKTGNYTLPETVEKIETFAFSESEVNTVVIPESVTQIGEHAFRYSKIAKVNIPKSLKSIEVGTFGLCENLIDINIGVGVTDIGNGAFYGCTSLEYLKIPASVENYGSNAFNGCTGLDTVEVDRQYPVWITANVFENVNLANVVLVVPDGSKSLHETADVWKDFGIIVEKSFVANDNPNIEAELSVYPNPASDYLKVQCSESSVGKDLKVFGINGALLYTRKITETQTVIDVSKYPAGIYIVNIDGKAVKFVRK
jgi:hypothetical protein